jgi:GH43 family beta-xylosidase/regulation of enolase protein 1 (concanavalin A-like superfamily)
LYFISFLLLYFALPAYTVDNPISYNASINDCDVIKYNGEYYIQGNWLKGDMLRSRDLESWGERRHVFSWNNSWHTRVNPDDPDYDIHGTHIRYINGIFHLYAHLDAQNGQSGITHAVSNDIWGPYTEPVDSPFAQWIDADTFLDDDGSLYFYSTVIQSGQSRIFYKNMSDPWTLTGSYNLLITPDENWYGTTNINEASKVFKYRGKYYMLYNAYGTTDSNYSLGAVEASLPYGFSNALKYSYPVLTRSAPANSAEEINTIGQAWVVEGLNGFEKWCGYFGVTASEGRTQRIDRIHFFDKKLFIDGPTNLYSNGYHPGPARPQLLSLFYHPDGPMPPNDWTIVWNSGNWIIDDCQAKQVSQTDFSFNTVNRSPAANYLIEANVKFTDPADNEDKCGVLAYYGDDNNWMIVGLDRYNDNWYCHIRQAGVDTVVGGGYGGSMNYNVYHKIRVEKNASQFHIRIDDKTPPGYNGPVNTAFSEKGLPGLYADNAAAAYDGVIYTIGWDEYDSYVTGWKDSSAGVAKTGNWTYSSGGISQTSQSGMNYIFKGDLMPEYEFTAQVTKSGTADGSMGIFPVCIDMDNYLVAEINLVNDQLLIYGYKDGVSVVSETMGVPDKNSYNLRAVKLSDRIIIFVDGEQKYTVYKNFPPSQVGLICQNMAAVYNGIMVYQTRPNNSTPWINTDVGSVNFSGDADLVNGTMYIKGSGSDIWHLEDGFHFAHRLWNADAQITTRLVSIEQSDYWSKGGIMFRDSLEDNSAMVMLCASPGAGEVQLIWRDQPGVGTGIHSITGQEFPVWLRLKRQGSLFTGYHSTDGQNWNQIGTCSPPVSDTVRLGFCVTAHNNDRVANAVFDNITAPYKTLPAPSPWTSIDIGQADFEGNGDYQNQTDTFIVEGSGTGIGDLQDNFHFLYRDFPGQSRITVKIAEFDSDQDQARAGLMIRNSIYEGINHCSLVVDRYGNLILLVRQSPDTGTGQYVIPNGPFDLPLWLTIQRTSLSKCEFEFAYSKDGQSWTTITPPLNWDLNCMEFNALAGLAVTSGSKRKIAGAVFGNYSNYQCGLYPTDGYFTSDCFINIDDLLVIVQGWLDTTIMPDGDITNDNEINFQDFAAIAENWLKCGWQPDDICTQ